MSRATEFIKKYKLSPDEFTLDAQLAVFLEEMKNGLEGKPSSMLMIPTYLQPKEDLKRNQTIVCADMGGTNLRVCAARFREDGTFDPGEITRYIMPGVEKMLTYEEFFATCAGLMAPYCEQGKDIVISFAYRTIVTPEIDGEIVEITKEVKVSGASGRKIAEEMKKAFDHLGIHDTRIIVINDSVATSLSGRGEHLDAGFGTCTGTILGTGSNSCYVEANKNITKLSGIDPNGSMVINTGAGSYNKMPRGQLDIEFDASTMNPGIGIAEKMTSGAYLGPLCELILRKAADENVFQSKALMEMEPGALTAAGVDEYLRFGSGVIEEFLVDDKDEAAAREILGAVISRAAKLVALQIAGCAVKADKSNSRVLMSIEGSCYEKMCGMKEGILGYLLPFLNDNGLEGTICEPTLAVLKGCTIAGLSTWY